MTAEHNGEIFLVKIPQVEISILMREDAERQRNVGIFKELVNANITHDPYNHKGFSGTLQTTPEDGGFTIEWRCLPGLGSRFMDSKSEIRDTTLFISTFLFIKPSNLDEQGFIAYQAKAGTFATKHYDEIRSAIFECCSEKK